MTSALPAFSTDTIDAWLAALEARSAHSPLVYGIQHEAAIRALCAAAEDAGTDADAVAQVVYERS